MKLSNSFRIDRPPNEVFDAFLDIERIATCLPGSRLLGQSAEDTYEGEVKVKVGPLGVAYAGELKLLDADRETLTLTMRAKGREKHGAGNADAHIVAQVREQDNGTFVEIATELSIRGKVAQFGRGVIGEVTDGIIAKFAANVEQMLSGDVLASGPASSGSGTRQSTAEPAGFVAAAESDARNGLDVWKLIVLPMLKKHAGVVVPAVVAAVAGYLGARAGARTVRQKTHPRYFN